MPTGTGSGAAVYIIDLPTPKRVAGPLLALPSLPPDQSGSIERRPIDLQPNPLLVRVAGVSGPRATGPGTSATATIPPDARRRPRPTFSEDQLRDAPALVGPTKRHRSSSARILPIAPPAASPAVAPPGPIAAPLPPVQVGPSAPPPTQLASPMPTTPPVSAPTNPPVPIVAPRIEPKEAAVPPVAVPAPTPTPTPTVAAATRSPRPVAAAPAAVGPGPVERAPTTSRPPAAQRSVDKLFDASDAGASSDQLPARPSESAPAAESQPAPPSSTESEPASQSQASATNQAESPDTLEPRPLALGWLIAALAILALLLVLWITHRAGVWGRGASPTPSAPNTVGSVEPGPRSDKVHP